MSTALEIEGEIVTLSPAQAAWMDAQRLAHRDDARRRRDCTGCRLFGLCALHDTPEEETE